MKKVFIVLFILALNGGLFAQYSNKTKKNKNTETKIFGDPIYSFSFSPLQLFFSTFECGVERKVAPKYSLMLNGSAGFREIALWEGLGGKYHNFGGQLELRKYITSKSDFIQGPYASTWVRMHRVNVSATIQEIDYSLVKSQGYACGVGMGWKFPVIRKSTNLTLDLNIGGGYKLGKVSGRYAEKSKNILFKDRGFIPDFNIQIGYSIGATKKKVAESNPKNKKYISENPLIAYHSRYNKVQRKSIEKALKKSGFFEGRPNGKFDEKTIQAIKQFQKKNGLKQDGIVGPNSLKRLGLNFPDN